MSRYEAPTLAVYTPFAALTPDQEPLLVLADLAEPGRASLHARIAHPPVWALGAPITVGSDSRQIVMMGATLDLTPLTALSKDPLLAPLLDLANTHAGQTGCDWLLDAAAAQLARLWPASTRGSLDVRVDRATTSDPRIVIARRSVRPHAATAVWL